MNTELSEKIGYYLRDNDLLLATAESCTAGLISSTIAETSGSSKWLDAGFVVYSAEAKAKSLGVNLKTIEDYDITSCEVAQEMSVGALKNSRANVSVSVTGLAGPGGGTPEIPVGTVCMSWAFSKNDNILTFEEKVLFNGDRNSIREQVVEHVLNQLVLYHKKILSNNNKLKI